MGMLSILRKPVIDGVSKSNPTHILNRIIFHKKSMDILSQNLMDSASKETSNMTLGDDEFRVLDLKKMTTRQKRVQRQRVKYEVQPPRTSIMKEDQDWTNVWPGPRTFHPAVVPLPLRQGHNKKKAQPGKYANAELMKIPNFLHLTPPHIEKHCEALKRFCTQWPTGLETDEKCDDHFPIQVITSDYCHSSPVIRDINARIVTIKLKLKRLPLNKHAKDKIRRLIVDHYDEKTDEITITTDRCPLRQQNYDHAMYLLTALFHESWRFESWEKEKSLEDMESYEWRQNQSYKNVLSLLSVTQPNLDPNNPSDEWKTKLEEYQSAIEPLFNDNENEDVPRLDKYKEASIKLLF